MTALTATGPTALAAGARAAGLAEIAPDLAAGLREQLPRAMDVVARRLIGAAHREGLTGGPGATTWSAGRAFLPVAGGGYLVTHATAHAFDRLEVTEPMPVDPARLLGRLTGAGPGWGEGAGWWAGAGWGAGADGTGAGPVETELADATVNLAVAYARRTRVDRELIAAAGQSGARDLVDLWADLDPDVRCVHFERLATEGHNLHPCGRTRLGWSAPDLLAHDLESPASAVGFVAVRRDLHVGDEIDLGLAFTDLDRDRYAVTPVHAWQLRHLAEGRYAELFADGALVRLDAELPALATGALRTLLLPDHGVSVKVSLDIQVTSTRRTISVASTRNGPVLSDLLARLLPECGDRVLLMPETAGSAAVTPLGERDLSAIVRPGLADRLQPGEVAIPGSALYAVSPLTGSTVVAELIDRYARSRERGRGRERRPDRSAAAREWLAAYIRLVLPPVLRMATRHGIGLEAHLQNCVPTFVDGRPHRLGLRDLAGMRVYPGRLAQAQQTPLWPGSVIVADSVDVMRSKVAYTVLQAHLGELALQLGRSHGLDERLVWADVRSVVDEVFDELAAEPALAGRARADHAFLTAPTVPHKALLGMRLAAVRGRGGDIYVRVGNPLR